MSSDVAISVRNLGKVYSIPASQAHLAGDLTDAPPARRRGTRVFTALTDVSFDIESGAIVGIVGRNGAGKSTLLKILSRITSPDAGSVEISGRVGSLLEVGTGFHPELTGRENVFLNGTLLGMKRREVERRFDTIVDFSGVEAFLDIPVKRYSSGMHVRLAFAVAAHMETQIVLVDEVLAVGDAAFQAKCLSKIESMSEDEGRTLLFVSHSMAPVRRMCERVIVMEKGRVDFDGDAKAAVTHYLQQFESDAASDGVWDLTQRDNPHPPHELWFRHVRLSTRDRLTEEFQIGDPIRIGIGFDRFEQLRDAIVGLRISSEMDLSIATFVFSLRELRRQPKDEVVLRIPHLSLTPGRYRISLGLSGYRGGILMDEVEMAGAFTVTAPGLTDEEWLRDNGDGVAVIKGTWSAS